MIPGHRGGLARLLRAAATTLAVGVVLVVAGALSAVPAAAAARTAAGVSSASGPWVRAWSWRAAEHRLPAGCAPYSGRTTSGLRWSPSLVSVAHRALELATAGSTGGRPTGGGLGCTGRPQRYGRVEVLARMPHGTGVVGRIALWPSAPSRGSDWSGLTVPSADVSPAYVTNGCGDEAFGAAVRAPLAGDVHRYALTWTPDGFTVAVDGRELYRDQASFDGPRWLGISLAATGASTRSEPLRVDEVVAYRWAGSRDRPASKESSSPAATRDQEVPAVAALDALAVPPPTGNGGTAGSSTAGSTAGGPGGPPDGPTAAALADERDGVLVAVLQRSGLSTPWLVGGGCVALCVLVGVLRSARAARRRPVVPR